VSGPEVARCQRITAVLQLVDVVDAEAGALPGRAHSGGIRAAFVAGDEVYSSRELRRGIRQRGMGYVLAVRANHPLAISPGRTMTTAAAAAMIPPHAWHRMRTGSGTRHPPL
jgi:hypothetical protein